MRFFLLLFSLMFILATPLEAAVAAPPPANVAASPDKLSREAVEAHLGRKLKFSERIALSIVRGKAKKQARKQAKADPDARILDVPSLLAMIFGILAVLLSPVVVLAFFLALAALILGIIGLGRIKRSAGARKGKGFAIAGIVLGGVWIVAAFLAALLFALTFNS